MAEKDLSERIAELAQREAAVSTDRKVLIEEIANLIHDRLLALFESRPSDEKARLSTFERWLGSQFEYDNFYAFAITEDDEELKKLMSMLLRVDSHHGRARASEVINRRLQQAEYHVGVSSNLLNIKRLEPSPVST